MMKKLVQGFVVATLAVAASWGNAAERAAVDVSESTPVDATVQLSGGAIAAGIGYVWGEGSVAFGHAQHHFSMNGLSLIDVGATGITASGNVYHLEKLSDFDGNYVALSAGATIAGGADAVYLRNQHGVVIKLTTTAVGLRFNLAANGVNIALKD